jgi:hypothetical protein
MQQEFLRGRKELKKSNSHEIYESFNSGEGSHSISNLRALELLEIIIKMDDSDFPILEIGAGIGTITTLLLRKTSVEIYAHELQDSCIDRLSDLQKTYPARLFVDSYIKPLAYKFVVIDGPYDKDEMFDALKSSKSSIRWIAIENGRTATRIQISSLLFRLGVRQQVVEFRRANYKPSLTVFFLDRTPYRQSIQIFLDYILVMSKFWPKYLKLLMRPGGSKHFRVGKKIEEEFGVVRRARN